MARDQAFVATTVGAWTEITNSNVSGSLTFQVFGAPHYIRYTTSATAPAAGARGVVYPSTTGALQKTMSELVNLSGALRVWAMPVGGVAGEIYVDHG